MKRHDLTSVTLSNFLCWRRERRRTDGGGQGLLRRRSTDHIMAFWPFGRKKNKSTSKSSEKDMAASRNKHPEDARRDPGQDATADVSSPTLSRKSSRKGSLRGKQRSSSRKLAKAQQSRLRDSEKANALPPGVPPLPSATDTRAIFKEKGLPGTTNTKISKPPSDRGDVPSYYFHNVTSMTSIQPEKFNGMERVPTLKNKRSANDNNLPRRKSSKRKADDHAREQEIKAMSSPIPIPKRGPSYGGGLLARDSKKFPSGMKRNFERPTSDVSLPIPESLHSSMSVASDQHGFKIRAFDALSPRPTIRYSENPRYGASPSALGPSRASTRKEKQPAVPEEVLKSRKRVDDLADDLDAGSLRELMERDRRRAERIRKSDQEKLQRRLQRKAEKQREEIPTAHEEVVAETTDKSDTGLGIGESSAEGAAQRSSMDPGREQSTSTPESWLKDPSREHIPLRDPFGDPVAGQQTSHLEDPTPIEEPDEPIVETAKAVRLSQPNMSPITSPITSPTTHVNEPSNLSQFTYLDTRNTPDIPERGEPERRDSDMSARFSSNWRSIFRRSGTRGERSSSDRGRKAPSEFSNTSRESFARQMPPTAFNSNRIPRARSGTPVQSRFREDLPELPMSPPDSRVQSPEVSSQTQLPKSTDGAPGVVGVPATQPLSDIHPAFREEVALSRHQSARSAHSPDGPSSAVLSQSLASVDSEGSWLTGRPVKRSSQQLNPFRESGSSLQKRLQELRGSEEELNIEEDEQEYMGPLTPSSDGVLGGGRSEKPRKLANDSGIGDENDEDIELEPASSLEPQEEGTWHSAVGRHPTIISQGARARSREGLLNDFQAGESEESSPTAGDSPMGQLPAPEIPSIQRATSVDFGKGHVRHISAGSARLLNLPARNSGESKRMSSASGERSPLGPPSPMPEAADVD